MVALIMKLFDNRVTKGDEFESMCAVTLTFSLLENVKGIESMLGNII